MTPKEKLDHALHIVIDTGEIGSVENQLRKPHQST